jgi:transposase
METPKLFIGLDVHKKTWTADIRTELSHHKTFSQPADPKQLEAYVDKNFTEYEIHLTYEAGCCGFWAARYFLNLAWNVKVVNPADVPRIDKQNYQKTDKLDSKNLSKCLANNTLKGIFIPTEQQDFLRCLIRQRNSVVKQLRVVKNRIKGFLLFMGQVIPEEYDNPNWSIAFQSWLKTLFAKHEMADFNMQSQLRILEILHQEYLGIGNKLREYYRKNEKENYYLLKSVPGIGGYIASVALSELGDFSRFKNEKQLSSYVGLVPGIYASGGGETKMGITPRCRSLLRTYLIEAAWVAVRADPEMQAYYYKHKAKNGKAMIVKVAHKLLRKMFAVIRNKTPYTNNIAKESKVTEAQKVN